MKINTLQDLKKVQKKLAEAHEKAQAELAARTAAATSWLHGGIPSESGRVTCPCCMIETCAAYPCTQAHVQQ